MSEETMPPEPADAIDPIAEKLAHAERQRDDLLRTIAEYENSRKRLLRDAEAERKYANTKLAGDLLPALDNLDRAIAADKATGNANPLAQGVLATHYQIIDILKRHGISKMVALGEAFDPHVHQAVQMMPSDAQAPNTVLSVLQEGFMIHDRVLRPASVVVAIAPTGG